MAGSPSRRKAGGNDRLACPNGHWTEWEALRGLEPLWAKGIKARHAEPEEDRFGHWDVEVCVCGFTRRLDLTTSAAEFAKKQTQPWCQDGKVVPVWVSAYWDSRALAHAVLAAVLQTLPAKAKRELAREFQQ